MPKSARTSEIGLQVEELALRYFLNRYPTARLLARNFRCRGGELDLVLDEGGDLVFVEVRSRRQGSWVGGVESVDGGKRRRLARAIDVFLARYRGPASGARVDILDWDGYGFRYVRNVRMDSN